MQPAPAGAAPQVVRVGVPSFRLDVTIPADLVEEVARSYGYDRLPMTLLADELPAQERNVDLELEDRVRDVLVGCGLCEIISYSMTNLESVAALEPTGALPDAAQYLRVANPLSASTIPAPDVMNTTLETGPVTGGSPSAWPCSRSPRSICRWRSTAADQPRRLSLALTGRANRAPAVQRRWRHGFL